MDGNNSNTKDVTYGIIFFILRIAIFLFSFGCLSIGAQFTKWYSGRLLERQKKYQWKNVETDYEIEIELTLNVRCSGQNSVFYWFYSFFGSSIQFYDNFMVLIYSHFEFKSVILLLHASELAARLKKACLSCWCLVCTHPYHSKIFVKRKRKKGNCHYIILSRARVYVYVCCKQEWKHLTRKFANSSVTLVLNDPLLFGQTHTHKIFSCWNINFQYFSLNCVSSRLTCECYAWQSEAWRGVKCDISSVIPCRRNENGIQNIFYVITMRHVVHHHFRHAYTSGKSIA